MAIHINCNTCPWRTGCPVQGVRVQAEKKHDVNSDENFIKARVVE